MCVDKKDSSRNLDGFEIKNINRILSNNNTQKEYVENSIRSGKVTTSAINDVI